MNRRIGRKITKKMFGRRWPKAQSYKVGTLMAALGVHRSGVRKWK